MVPASPTCNYIIRIPRRTTQPSLAKMRPVPNSDLAQTAGENLLGRALVLRCSACLRRLARLRLDRTDRNVSPENTWGLNPTGLKISGGRQVGKGDAAVAVERPFSPARSFRYHFTCKCGRNYQYSEALLRGGVKSALSARTELYAWPDGVKLYVDPQSRY